MKNIIVLLTLVLFTLGTSITARATNPSADIRGAVRLMTNDSGNGSGVVIRPGYVLTAKHVAKADDGDLYIEPEHIKATLVRESLDGDLAIMSVPGIQCPCAVLATEAPVLDSEVVIIGYPLNYALHTQIRTVGTYQGSFKDMYVTTASASSGNSGGGLFQNNKLIGILVGVPKQGASRTGAIMYNSVSVSIRLQAIREFLGKHFS